MQNSITNTIEARKLLGTKLRHISNFGNKFLLWSFLHKRKLNHSLKEKVVGVTQGALAAVLIKPRGEGKLVENLAIRLGASRISSEAFVPYPGLTGDHDRRPGRACL